MPKLTHAERAILINQLRILQAIQPDRDESVAITALEEGYEGQYEQLISGFSEPLPEEKGKYVEDVLWLYFLMKQAKNKSADGRASLADKDPQLPGWDYNTDEGRLGRYAEYLMKERKSFLEHRPYMNSHGATLDYRAMLEKWRELGKPTDMTAAQVDEILAQG